MNLSACKMKALVAQWCPTLSDPWTEETGSSVHGVLQARILGWVAISFTRGSSWPRDRTQVFCIEGKFFIIWATREAPIQDTWMQSPFRTEDTKMQLNFTNIFEILRQILFDNILMIYIHTLYDDNNHILLYGILFKTQANISKRYAVLTLIN